MQDNKSYVPVYVNVNQQSKQVLLFVGSYEARFLTQNKK